VFVQSSRRVLESKAVKQQKGGIGHSAKKHLCFRTVRRPNQSNMTLEIDRVAAIAIVVRLLDIREA
jgi:hypothetical protein